MNQVARAIAPPDITTLLVNYNTAHLFDECFGKLTQASAQLSTETIVVDNQSRDGSAQVLRERFPHIKLIESGGNLGFGRANNLALTHVHGRYLLLLNTDAFVQGDTLIKTLAYMDAHPECGVLGVRLEGPDGNLQPSCRYFPTPLNIFLWRTGLAKLMSRVKMVDDLAWAHDTPRVCDWVPGCYYMIRREVIEKVGLFDPRFFMYMEEVDHCRRTQAAGWQIHFFPSTTVVHIGGESAKSDGKLTESGSQLKDLQVESSLLYFRKWGGVALVLTWLILSILVEIFDATKLLAHRKLTRDATVRLTSNLCLLLRSGAATRLGRISSR
jgi:N-acetylglucosaminyl-diphospho-decaprenol L-rhamnosyltransferase